MAIDTADLRLLKIFVVIVEAGGFAAAQGELNLSLSTISSHVAALEARLGLRLCRRGRAGFRLTAEGQAVYTEVKHLVGTLEQFDDRIRALREQLTGTLSIGLVDNTISDPSSRLERVIARMTDEMPQVALSLTTRPPHELLKEIISGQLQIAIASFPRTTLGLDYVHLYSEAQRFYCGSDHPFFSRPDAEITIEEVRQHNLVGRSYWGSRDLKIFSVASPRAVVSDMEAEARLILSGRYLGYLPEHFARQFVEGGRMRSIRPDLFGYKANFQVAYEPASAEGGLVANVLAMLAAEFNAAAPGTGLLRSGGRR